MRIFVTAKPRAKEERVEKIDETHFVVAVTEPPVEGRANEAIVRALAKHFGVSSQNVRIVSGHTSRQKIVDVL
ncbi:hypothetical protein A2110_02420 [Candidatus Jorgensenbacteria bacterium GWA1_54_12]|uniref:UPF0235 protein A2110_02420 n=1 Tax=Candidatus Jorgensenbacteria bacterium GWA1_54_12 TaxID=1798468 RepID=A0A1F6BKV9_9BACT|nr:MAG: hypothetical protein A2110_02420 [Candidatus Jorgensenbacteria bacterium GWA1_54_12]